MTRKQRRFSLIGAALGILALAVALVLNALKDSIVFFNTPTEVVEKQVKPGTRLRIGGLVKEGSVLRGDGLAVRFEVTDGRRTVSVAYHGLLPDLFREGQGVIAEGALDPGGIFRADSVLAKHDETYMPKDVADALKRQGHWKDAPRFQPHPVRNNGNRASLKNRMKESAIEPSRAQEDREWLRRVASFSQPTSPQAPSRALRTRGGIDSR